MKKTPIIASIKSKMEAYHYIKENRETRESKVEVTVLLGTRISRNNYSIGDDTNGFLNLMLSQNP